MLWSAVHSSNAIEVALCARYSLPWLSWSEIRCTNIMRSIHLSPGTQCFSFSTQVKGEFKCYEGSAFLSHCTNAHRYNSHNWPFEWGSVSHLAIIRPNTPPTVTSPTRPDRHGRGRQQRRPSPSLWSVAMCIGLLRTPFAFPPSLLMARGHRQTLPKRKCNFQFTFFMFHNQFSFCSRISIHTLLPYAEV